MLTLAGLKRGEIGEIASKIGQLYYNFYLRNAETRYLLESYTFYQAIHSRQVVHTAFNMFWLSFVCCRCDEDVLRSFEHGAMRKLVLHSVLV